MRAVMQWAKLSADIVLACPVHASLEPLPPSSIVEKLGVAHLLLDAATTYMAGVKANVFEHQPMHVQ